MKVLLIVYDSGTLFHVVPVGLAYVAAVLKIEGHEVVIYNQDQNHYPEEHLKAYIEKNRFDAIGLSMVAGYYQYSKMKKISKVINEIKDRPIFILGGHGPAAEPEFFLKKMNADVVVIGEGELTTVELFNNLESKKSLKGVKGLAYRENDEVIVNERRPLIKDINTIPFPAYELFPMDYYRLLRHANAGPTDFVITMLSGRGCKFKCNFCYRLDKGIRIRSNESIIEEIELLRKDYGATYIAFCDELLMESPKRVISLCEDLIKRKLNIKWSCTGHLSCVEPEVLEIMKRSGCDFIVFGIESLDDIALQIIRKQTNYEMIIKGVEATIASGISTGLSMLFGHIGDTRENLEKAVEFLLKYGTQNRPIRPVTPYPGSELYYIALEKGLLKDVEDFYENKHKNSDLVCVNFTDIPDDEIHRLLFKANQKIARNYFDMQVKNTIECLRKLYIEGERVNL